MRVLFYLPVVTPWWFENIVAPLIRVTASEAEVHVLVPTFWNSIGIGPTQLAPYTDLPHVHWHLMPGEENAALRVSAADCPELLDFVHQIRADYTICRSADFETPAKFPGKVRYLMEGGVPPFPTENHWAVLTSQPFDNGCLPALPAADRERLATAIAPAWKHMHERFAAEDPSREAGLAALGLPTDKRIIALPLEYEHHENLFGVHRSYQSNRDVVLGIAAHLGPDELLAVTDHPLNQLHVDTTEMRRAVASLGDRAVLMPNVSKDSDDIVAQRINTTARLIGCCDGVFVELSKSFSVAGFFGTPMMRNTPFRTGGWLRSFSNFDDFLKSLRAGKRREPAPDDARVWFGFHLLNDVIDTQHLDLGAADIIGHFEQPVDPRRWDAALERYCEYVPELFA